MTAFMQTFFGKLLTKLKNLFTDGLDDVGAMIVPMLPQIKEIGTDAVKAIAAAALLAVKAAAADGKSGKALIDVAYQAAKDESEKQGKDIYATTASLIATVVTSHAQADATAEVPTVEVSAQATPLQQVAFAEPDFTADDHLA